jgi:hypothetical protein
VKAMKTRQKPKRIAAFQAKRRIDLFKASYKEHYIHLSIDATHLQEIQV